MAKRSKASYKAAAKKAAATKKRNAAGKKKKAQAAYKKRKPTKRSTKKVSTAGRRKGACTSTWTRIRWPKGKVINGKKVGGTFKTNKGKAPTGRKERAHCPDTRTVR